MACVVLPWLFVAGQGDELRAVAGEVIAAVDGGWPAVLSADGFVRALAAAGETDLLGATVESLRRSAGDGHVARRGFTLLAAEGLQALAIGRVDDAVRDLRDAVVREEALGFDYDAAVLKLDLARALESSGGGGRGGGDAPGGRSSLAGARLASTRSSVRRGISVSTG